MPVSPDLLAILRCPACVTGPTRRTDVPDPGLLDLVRDVWLVCHDCGRKYPICDDIPRMLIDEGDKYRSTPVEQLVTGAHTSPLQ
jgi:uncharacterized protein YbaR (Trm112 family)